MVLRRKQAYIPEPSCPGMAWAAKQIRAKTSCSWVIPPLSDNPVTPLMGSLAGGSCDGKALHLHTHARLKRT